MKNLNLKKEAIIWMLLLAPFLYAMIMWNRVPDRLPTHFDLEGKPDDYSGKGFALLVLPAANVLVYLVLLFIPGIDPRRKNYDLFGSSYQNIRLIIHLFFVGIQVYTTQLSLFNGDVRVSGLFAMMFLFFAFLGNYMRTVRSNFFIGIRTPWTLSNDVVWRKTHELGGRIWFYGGLAGAPIVFFLEDMAAGIFMAAVLAVMVLVPVVYSYFEYRKVTAEPQKTSKE